MSRWSKAATSLMQGDSSMPLPKTSPDMSPTPATVKGWRLDVDVHLAEMPLHRLPGAARGDAHRLVVVAGRAARGEGVAEPEAALQRDARWRCRRRSPCPCRPRRRDRDRRRRGAPRRAGGTIAVAVDVVGDGEQPVDEARCRPAAPPRRSPRGRRAGSRIGTKPPLAPTGTMTAFFTCCALTSPSTSVRKSCGRSDQRRPPRATGPKRMCTPSTCGECTKISRNGRGAGTKARLSGLDLQRDRGGGSRRRRRRIEIGALRRPRSPARKARRIVSSSRLSPPPAPPRSPCRARSSAPLALLHVRVEARGEALDEQRGDARDCAAARPRDSRSNRECSVCRR